MRAFMSEGQTRPDFWNGSTWVGSGVKALREAERIVAETERPRYFDGGPAMDHEAFEALAADLAAIMPELDRLALDASLCALETDPVAMFERNRATLAAMDAR